MKSVVMSLSAVLAISSFGYAESPAPQIAGPLYVDDLLKEGLYAGIAYARPSHDVDYDNDTQLLELDSDSIMVHVGYRFSLHRQYIVDLAIEGRYWKSLRCENSDTEQEDDTEISLYGIYVKPIYPINKEIDVYAMFGYAKSNETSPHSFLPVDEGDFSWATGMSVDIADDLAFFADYHQFYQKAIGDYHHVIDGYTVGLSYRF